MKCLPPPRVGRFLSSLVCAFAFLIIPFSCTEKESLSPEVPNLVDNSINYSIAFISASELSKIIKNNINNASQEEDYMIVDNVVRFKNYEKFDHFTTNLEASKKVFAKSFANFQSKESKFNNFIEEADKAKDENSFRIILDIFSDDIEIVDDRVLINDETPFDFIISSVQKPYFYVGNIIYMYYQGNQYIIADGNLNTVEKIKKGEKTLKNVIKSSYQVNSIKNARSTSATCGFMSGFFQISHNNGNRRGNSSCEVGYQVTATGGTINGEPEMKVLWRVYTRGQVEKKLWFLWIGFNSNNELLVNYKANAVFNGSIVESYEPNFSEFNNNYFISHTALISPGPAGFYIPQSQISLISANLEQRSGRLINWELAGAAVIYRCN